MKQIHPLAKRGFRALRGISRLASPRNSPKIDQNFLHDVQRKIYVKILLDKQLNECYTII